MFSGRRIAVVVPAHNEERLVALAVGGVPGWVDHVIVVDDASSDDTVAAVRGLARPGLELLGHDENRGVGAAIVTGYRRALELDCVAVAVMAGDAQMDGADLAALVRPVVEGHADYAKGDRLRWPGVFRLMPFWRFLGNHLFSRLTRLASGYRELSDSQCGFTVISARMLERIDLDALYTRYGFPNDLLAHLNAAGARLFQAPVRPIYESEVSGISLVTALVRVPLVILRSGFVRRRLAAGVEVPARLEPAGH